MSLDSALAISTGGLANISAQLAVISQNVANANTPDYAREVATQTSLTAQGLGMGVSRGPTARDIDLQVQTDLFRQDSAVAGLQTKQSALQRIDAVQGTPGGGTDLSSLLGKVQDSFSTLSQDPSSQTQQAQVVNSATNLVSQINTLATTYATVRQTAQDGVVADVATLNTTLGTIGSLSTQIVSGKAQGQSTAGLENQRDAAMHTLSQLIDVNFLKQSNGDVLAVTAGGTTLPIHAAAPPFQTNAATIGAGSFYPGGGVPPVTLNGIDVTAQLTGGTLGANIALRDSIVPSYQATLDQFSQTLSDRFQQQGLTLFSDPTGTVPAAVGVPVQSGYVGYSQTIQVNPAVLSAPNLVRDGTDTIAGSASGASAFTPNPPGGPAGVTGLISRVLNFALGSQVQAGVAQPPPPTNGLGPSGTLNAPFAPPPDLASFATNLVGAQAQDSATATSDLSTEKSVQTALQTNLSTRASVNIDTEMGAMVQLQNAYGANARVISAIQTLWTQLLAAVVP